MKDDKNKAEAGTAQVASHTPTPWAMHPIYTNGTLTHWGINGVNDTGTMFTSGRIVDVPRNVPNHDGPTQEANAAFTVRACNAHAELLEALRQCVYWLETPETAKRTGCDWRKILDEARAAIAKAERGQA